MSNTYTVQFTVLHPESNNPMPCKFTVKVPPQIVVDTGELVGAGVRMASKPRRPEDIADTLRTQFPGKQTLTGQHLGARFKLQREGRA